MKPVTSNLACSWGLPRCFIKSHQKKTRLWPWARGALQNLGFPFNISATAGVRDFKFGTQFGLAKGHHEITPRGKLGVALTYGNSLKLSGFPVIFLQWLKLVCCKFGAQLRFAKDHHKITHRGKRRRGPGLGELPKIWRFPFNIYTMAEASDFKCGTHLGLPRPIIKSHP